MAPPSMIRKLWKRADGQWSAPCLFIEIMWTKAGKTNTKARPHVAPENLPRETKLASVQSTV